MVVQSFFAPFGHFESLTQAHHFAKAIAIVSWPILAIFKMLSFFEHKVFFLERFFAHNNSNVVVQSFFAPFGHFESLTQTGHIAKDITCASWSILAIFEMLSFFQY